MRRPFLAGNWKMNKTSLEAVELIKGLLENLKQEQGKDILVAPPFTALNAVNNVIKGSTIKLGAQNCSYAEKGAYTGEVSPGMLKEIGCDYVILGHSERRQYFAEDNEIVNKKIVNALNNGLKVIFCIGETLQEREGEITFQVIEQQVTQGLKGIDLQNLTIAYEPIWAIGTGRTASPEQAEQVHKFIRELIEKLYSKEHSDKVRILYGGSVTPDNIEGLMACPNVDGGLVGGASLKIDSFSDLVKKT